VSEPAAIAAAIRALLLQRAAASSICPSEVARALADDWRTLMPAVREAAAAMAARGELRITHGGLDVPRERLHQGAIRLARGERFDE
jgi:hypothetical protein